MEVRVADNCGFCFGVRRAIDLAESTLRSGAEVYCLGPLIHNPQVIERLIERGFRVVEGPEDLPAGATVVIRSHGVAPEIFAKLREREVHVVDATCPLVKRAQDRARELARQGYRVVIVGERDHPEVDAIVGIVGTEAVVADCELPDEALSARKVGVIAQTTQDSATLRQVVRQLVDTLVDTMTGELRVFNTICNATLERQEAAVKLAGEVEVMFVLGGRNSANTARLAEICAATGVRTFHMETADEIDTEVLTGAHTAGVTAGASTPSWIIEEFVKKLEDIPG